MTNIVLMTTKKCERTPSEATVHALATKFLSHPVHVGVGSVDEGVVANTAIRQIVEVIKNEKEKPTRLLHYLKKHYSPEKKACPFVKACVLRLAFCLASFKFFQVPSR